MEADITDDRIARDLRRYQLAIRLIAHRARTHTICDLTGLTRHQLDTLRRRWMVSSRLRHRGPSPRSYSVFFRSPRARSEAACLALLCHMHGGVPRHRGANVARTFSNIDSGERLCDAYEAYIACFPESDIEFEQLVLLAIGLSQADVIALGRCSECEGALLIDCLGPARRVCSHCQCSHATFLTQAPSMSPDDPKVPPCGSAIQPSLF